MLDLHIPDLTFPMVEFGAKEARWDMRRFLYKGGAKASVRNVFNLMDSGVLGKPIVERIELVTRLHRSLTAMLVGGSAKNTASTCIYSLKKMFSWADEDVKHRPLTLQSVEVTYRLWADALLNSKRLKALKEKTIYEYANHVSLVLRDVLDRSTPLIKTTRIRFPKERLRAVSAQADKQNLADTFAFGHLLLDIIHGLSGKAIWGPLPVSIPLRTGVVIEQWSGMRIPGRIKANEPDAEYEIQARRSDERLEVRNSDQTLQTRFPLANLRLEAELLVFIAQTSINLSQAHKLKVSQYSYQSTIDGYQVRSYKERRKGEVLFEIYSEYKSVFENYLIWRKEVFPESDQLFPFIRDGGRAASTAPKLERIREICRQTGVKFVCPRKLRKTRINWLLRQSRDPDLTAEQAQHAKETLLRVYEQPSQQVAMIEIIQFWPDHDPALRGDPQPCPAPGICDGIPQPVWDLPAEAPKPDCSHPAGCLFCAHHRDIDSDDYVWSVACMRHLKTIVLHGFQPAEKGKDSARHIELAIEVLTAKLKWFKDSNQLRRIWVEEALERVNEFDFHPHWRYLIESAQDI